MRYIKVWVYQQSCSRQTKQQKNNFSFLIPKTWLWNIALDISVKHRKPKKWLKVPLRKKKIFLDIPTNISSFLCLLSKKAWFFKYTMVVVKSSKKQVLLEIYFDGNLFFKLSAEMIYVHVERNFNFTWKRSKRLVHIWWEESPYNSNKKVLYKLLILVFEKFEVTPCCFHFS